MNIVGSICFVGVPVLMENLILIGLLGCNFVFIYEVRICLVRKFVGEAKTP